VAIAFALSFFFPFYYTVISSLKQSWEFYSWPPVFWPEKLQFRNYLETWNAGAFAMWFRNTVVIVILSVSGGVLTSAMGGYSFARFRYRFKDALFAITLSTMMLPAQITLIPQFILFFKLGQWTPIQWLDSIKPLWVPAWFGGGAFAIFMMRQFIQTLPPELDEAALVDGASYPRIFWSIVLPLCKPALATLSILSILGAWNSFLAPMIYINSPEKFPISVGVRYFQINYAGLVDYKQPRAYLLMCASVLSTIVPIVIFFSFQRFFVHGVVMTGIKG
jgi:multiple sugar transport system permease protein